MKWDVKITLYLFLGYAFYGLSYLFTNGDYVVPLPMLFVFIPIVSLTFVFSLRFNSYTFFFLLLPLLIMGDKINEFSPTLSDIAVFLSIVSWLVLGLFLQFDKTYRKLTKLDKLLQLFPLICFVAMGFFFNNLLFNVSIFLGFGVISGIIIRKDEMDFVLPPPIRRIFVLVSFVSWMYLITLLSVYLG